ncbi:hypothetical protein RvY_02791 [Ramazzottius varieornatus]|uniref:Uncharacterized protein n=1 Tax=Ramazzottius varieornatus TaxID=947166 RepID=A0A1D1UT04_RAMVA|nr:hypothetical protein RvY_02791 [Ramazzottius varieornatus]
MNEGLARVQAAVESMIVVEKIVKADNLTEGEWRVLKGVVKFLGKFKLKINFSSPIKPVDYPTFNMYGWGLPCRSPLIPANFSAEYADYLSRPSEIQLGHCQQPCPVPPPMVFITDSKGKIIDQFEGTEGGVYSLDSGPPQLPAMVHRVTAYEEEGDRIRMMCPNCYYDGRLVATTKLFVNPRRNRNLKKNIMIFGIVIVAMFFLVAIIYLIRNT